MRLKESTGVCIERHQKESKQTKNKSMLKEILKGFSSGERLPGFYFGLLVCFQTD